MSVLHKLGTTVLDGAAYTYDGAGNRLTRTDKRLGTTLTYGYDNIYQLLSAKQGSATKESYTYDIVGNRLSSLGVSPYSYNSSNELTALPSGSYGYDKNGNTQSKPDGTQYMWDLDNELTQVTLPGTGGTLNFKYDPFGRRSQKSFTQNGVTTATDYVYDGANRIEDVGLTGNLLARYVQSNSIDEPLQEIISGTSNYYEHDGLGSVTSLSNSTGALANTYTYDSYGKLLASTGTTPNPFQFTSREFDAETGEYFYRARYYDQNVGRFISEDPIGFDGGINYYSYARNNPTNYTDPSGENIASCLRALAELAKATAQVENDLGGFGPPGTVNPGHQKTLQQAMGRLKNALAQVARQCTCTAAELAAAVAAAEAAAEAALAAAAPYLLAAA